VIPRSWAQVDVKIGKNDSKACLVLLKSG